MDQRLAASRCLGMYSGALTFSFFDESDGLKILDFYTSVDLKMTIPNPSCSRPLPAIQIRG